MLLHRPLATVTSTVDADILPVLASADQPFTGRQLARLIPQRSTRGVTRALQRLVDHGIVRVSPAGNANLYELNRQHVAADPIVALSRLRHTLAERISEHVAQWQQPADLVVLFGSAARNEMSLDSDIDLFVVSDYVGTDTWDTQAHRLAQQVRAWTGNDCRILEMARLQVTDGVGDDPVLAEIAREGQTLHGDASLLRRARAAAKGR